MTYYRLAILTDAIALRMRAVAIFFTVVILAAAHLPAEARDRTVAKGIHQCHPEPEGGCIGIKGRRACRAHPRCQWTKDAAGDYCRRIYCWI